MKNRHSILVCYDVCTTSLLGEQRLRRVAKACEAFGQRVQYSTFECSLTDVTLHKLRQRLLSEIEPAEDNLRIYFLSQSRKEAVEVYGINKWIDFDGPLIL